MFRQIRPASGMLVPKAAVEGLDMRIACRRAGTRIVKLHFVEIRPGIQRSGDEFGSVIDFDPWRQPVGCLDFSSASQICLPRID